MMNSENKTITYAHLGQRILGRSFDLAINYLLQALLLWLVAFLDIVGGAGLGFVLTTIIFSSSALTVLYFWLFSINGRQTPGYRLAGLELQTADGKSLSVGRGLWRSLVLVVSIAVWCCALLPVLWALLDKRKRTTYDYLCGTQVVSVRKAKVVPLIVTIVVGFAIFFAAKVDLIFPFPLRAYYLPSGSMENTLRVDDRLLVNTQIYRWRAPQSGEIVVFKAPMESLLNNADPNEDVDFIKRIVAIPGQKAEIVDGQLFVNAQKINEPYKKPVVQSQLDVLGAASSYDMKVVNGSVFSRDYLAPNQPGPWMENNVIVSGAEQKAITQAKTEAVPEGKLLVLGDNRGNSNDSHVWGFTPVDSLRGRVMLRFWPFDQVKWFADADSPAK